MYKYEFLTALREQLVGLPKEDIEERISFYEEMINDRIDEGKSEQEAVAEIGSVDEVVRQIAGDTKLVRLVKEKMRPKRRLHGWEIAIIIAGFPVWFPLLITSIVLAFVAYLMVWVLVVVTYSVETGLLASAALCGFSFIMSYVSNEPNYMLLGQSIAAAGGAILMFFGCYGSTKLTIGVSRHILVGIKSAFIRRGGKR